MDGRDGKFQDFSSKFFLIMIDQALCQLLQDCDHIGVM